METGKVAFSDVLMTVALLPTCGAPFAAQIARWEGHASIEARLDRPASSDGEKYPYIPDCGHSCLPLLDLPGPFQLDVYSWTFEWHVDEQLHKRGRSSYDGWNLPNDVLHRLYGIQPILPHLEFVCPHQDTYERS
eukprot:CAMPEP_0172422682 /NCGR_PEP_ID=MMETSP1064-20121228/8807_1 /TAXON_ID=202472 /ORGANISM="Aulacoseira subarctica , Strain CCAP 1002/5" /LENGTH=134 /DNA_ID=CAMNT_0013163649 /DNA_START=102 /DNA_END=507 /DNA_ORIENTATION=-